IIYQNAAAVFAGNDLLALSHLKLNLRRNDIEAAATGIALNRYDGKTIAIALPDALVCFQQTLFTFSLSCLCAFAQCLLFFFSLGDSGFESVLLEVEVSFFGLEFFLGFLDNCVFRRYLFLDY